MTPLTLVEANRMLAAAVAKATDMKINPCTIAILDPRGDLIALNRMDNALWRSVPISQGNAAASAAFDTPSGELTERWGNPVVRGAREFYACRFHIPRALDAGLPPSIATAAQVHLVEQLFVNHDADHGVPFPVVKKFASAGKVNDRFPV